MEGPVPNSDFFVLIWCFSSVLSKRGPDMVEITELPIGAWPLALEGPPWRAPLGEPLGALPLLLPYTI